MDIQSTYLKQTSLVITNHVCCNELCAVRRETSSNSIDQDKMRVSDARVMEVSALRSLAGHFLAFSFPSIEGLHRPIQQGEFSKQI